MMEALDTSPGWPRPVFEVSETVSQRIKGRVGKRRNYLPVMWVSGDHPQYQNWAGICHERMDVCVDSSICIVCGEEYGRNYVSAKLDPSSNLISKGHPRCILLAVTNCPHFHGMEVVAYDRPGYPLTVTGLRELVKEGDGSA